jgi:hypothetical protein
LNGELEFKNPAPSIFATERRAYSVKLRDGDAFGRRIDLLAEG